MPQCYGLLTALQEPNPVQTSSASVPHAVSPLQPGPLDSAPAPVKTLCPTDSPAFYLALLPLFSGRSL